MLSKLGEIERSLKHLLLTDRRAWVASFRMMEEVKKQQLWKPGYSSFSNWLSTISEATRIHISVLWDRLFAGEYYLRFEAREARAGRSAPSLEKARLGVEKLKYIFRIAGGSAERERDLMAKASEGILTGTALRQTWKMEREERRLSGRAVGFANGYERRNAELKPDTVSEAPLSPRTDLILALARTPSWLPGSSIKPYFQDGYELFSELAVAPGRAFVPRFDALAAESVTTRETGRVALHGFAVCASAQDLDRLQNLRAQLDFVDFYWLAATEKALESLGALPDSWDAAGILALTDQGTLTVKKNASALHPLLRSVALEAVLFQSIKKVRDTTAGKKWPSRQPLP